MRPRILQPFFVLLCIAALISVLFAGCGSATVDEYEREVTALNELAAEKMAEVSEALAGGSQEEEGSHESEAEGAAEEEGSHEEEAEVESGEGESHEEAAESGEGEASSAEEEEASVDGESHEGEDSPEGEDEGMEALAAALEEAIETLKTVMLELEDVKVPEGMEDFHRSLLAFYQGNLATYEGLLAALGLGEAHGEEGASHGEEEGEGHEEDAGEEHGEENSHEEESSSGGH